MCNLLKSNFYISFVVFWIAIFVFLLSNPPIQIKVDIGPWEPPRRIYGALQTYQDKLSELYHFDEPPLHAIAIYLFDCKNNVFSYYPSNKPNYKNGIGYNIHADVKENMTLFFFDYYSDAFADVYQHACHHSWGEPNLNQVQLYRRNYNFTVNVHTSDKPALHYEQPYCNVPIFSQYYELLSKLFKSHEELDDDVNIKLLHRKILQMDHNFAKQLRYITHVKPLNLIRDHWLIALGDENRIDTEVPLSEYFKHELSSKYPISCLALVPNKFVVILGFRNYLTEIERMFGLREALKKGHRFEIKFTIKFNDEDRSKIDPITNKNHDEL